MFKPSIMPKVKDTAPSEWRINALNGGIVYTDLPQLINDNQSPDMLNMWFKEKALTKRYGQENFITGFPGPVLNSIIFNGVAIVHSDTKLYSINMTTGAKTEIYSSLTANKGSFFTFRNKSTGENILYYKQTGHYIQYDGTTVSSVVGYVPKVIVGRSASGGGTVLEQYNMLAAGFINSFSPDGTSKDYPLTQTGLDVTTVTCTLNGVAKVENTDFTVNRTTGVVTFTTAPATGTDTLLITAYKTSSADTTNFLPLYLCTTFGGNNDTRVFMAGGSCTYYWSGLLDPTYFPENQYNNAGSNETQIYGFGKQYNVLVIFKSDSMYSVTYTCDSDGSNPQFPMALLSANSGCDCPWTIQSINDCLVWLHTKSGVCVLNSTLIKDEKDISPLSFNIDGTILHPGLMNNTVSDLQSATSFDFFGMYWLCVGNKAWLWDYMISPYAYNENTLLAEQVLAWFPQDAINANCWFNVGNELYYGDRTNGNIVHFINSYVDFNNAINAYVETKKLDFGCFDWYKFVSQVRYASKSDVMTYVTVQYSYDDGVRIDNKIDNVGSFFWNRFRWDTFTWGVIRFARTFTKYPKVRSFYFSVRFSNNRLANNLSILDIAITYTLYKHAR